MIVDIYQGNVERKGGTRSWTHGRVSSILQANLQRSQGCGQKRDSINSSRAQSAKARQAKCYASSRLWSCVRSVAHSRRNA